MNEGKPPRDRVLEAFEAVSLAHRGPTRREKRRKRWGVLEVTHTCYECGRNDYRLVWPWAVTHDDVPILFVNSWLDKKIDRLETEWGGFRHNWAEPDEWRKTDE